MANSGYSGTPLIKKLGIKYEYALLLLNIPAGINNYWKLIETALHNYVIEKFALANNLVDVKICAVTEEWSGLNLAIPLVKR